MLTRCFLFTTARVIADFLCNAQTLSLTRIDASNSFSRMYGPTLSASFYLRLHLFQSRSSGSGHVHLLHASWGWWEVLQTPCLSISGRVPYRKTVRICFGGLQKKGCDIRGRVTWSSGDMANDPVDTDKSLSTNQMCFSPASSLVESKSHLKSQISIFWLFNSPFYAAHSQQTTPSHLTSSIPDHQLISYNFNLPPHLSKHHHATRRCHHPLSHPPNRPLDLRYPTAAHHRAARSGLALQVEQVPVSAANRRLPSCLGLVLSLSRLCLLHCWYPVVRYCLAVSNIPLRRSPVHAEPLEFPLFFDASHRSCVELPHPHWYFCLGPSRLCLDVCALCRRPLPTVLFLAPGTYIPEHLYVQKQCCPASHWLEEGGRN